jgi:hypothetical protein
MANLIELVVILALVGGLAAGAMHLWHEFTGRYVEQGKQAQIAADQPVLDKAHAERDAAQSEATAARNSEASCKAAADVIAQQAQRDKARSDSLAASLADSKRRAAKAATDAAPKIDALRNDATDKTVRLLACQDELDVTAKELRAQAKERLKAQ